MRTSVLKMGIQPFYGKVPQQLLWAGSWTACEKVISNVPNSLNYSIIFIIST